MIPFFVFLIVAHPHCSAAEALDVYCARPQYWLHGSIPSSFKRSCRHHKVEVVTFSRATCPSDTDTYWVVMGYISSNERSVQLRCHMRKVIRVLVARIAARNALFVRSQE